MRRACLVLVGCLLERTPEPSNELARIDIERIEDGQHFEHVHPALTALALGVPRLPLPELVGYVALGLARRTSDLGDQLDENLIVTPEPGRASCDRWTALRACHVL